MDTTLLFVELVIAGVQASTWLIMLIVVLFGYAWVQVPVIAEWKSVALVLLLAFSYPLGVVFDRFADLVFEPWNKRLQKRYFPNPPCPIVVMRFQITKDDEHLNHQFEYTRTRMRIARASAINLGLIAILATALVLLRAQGLAAGDRVRAAAGFLGIGACMVSLCVYAWRNLMVSYLRLVKAHAMASGLASSGPTAGAPAGSP